MNLTFSTPPDKGLVVALGLSNISKNGIAAEFGMGTGRNIRECAKRGFSSYGYDVAPWVVEEAQTCAAKQKLKVQILCQDVLDVELKPNSLSIGIVGTTIYWPKSVVAKFLPKLWIAIKVNGVLHIEFATPRDGSFDSEFCVCTCFPFPEQGYSNSFGHHCDYVCEADHPGVIGASFWEQGEAVALLRTLGPWKMVHVKIDQWHQTFVDDQTKFFRSFERVTIQKTS